MSSNDIPLHERIFGLDDTVLTDIEDFISTNSKTFEEAALLRDDILNLAEGYDMWLDNTHMLRRLK